MQHKVLKFFDFFEYFLLLTDNVSISQCKFFWKTVNQNKMIQFQLHTKTKSRLQERKRLFKSISDYYKVTLILVENITQ